ncbi:MAG: SDR family oxidoreductase [Opitutaceae bacterium]|nr:SDR family oxidoreductase [Opitutaceae bacterium]
MSTAPLSRLILVTGATGYVGGRLVPRLLEAGYRVRCLVRDPARLQGRSWLGQVEVVAGDVLQEATLPSAMQGVEAVYYLVHSLGGGSDFSERDLLAARNCAEAARSASVSRIIYLGGLGDPQAELSPHLRSRQETGAALCEAGVPVTEFRAAVIVGSGSLSFEMIRYLTERLPVMICPRWVFTRVQPIAIRNVLDYLVAALECPESAGRVLEIGGQDVLTYAGMMTGYARARGLTRRLLSVPVLTPRLSSYWVHLITPIPATIARPLIKGLGNEVVVRDDTARRLFPGIPLLDYDTAVRLALGKIETHGVETAWSDALTSSQGQTTPVALLSSEGMIIERRQRPVSAGTAAVYRSFASLGGKRGWLYLNWTWQLRGMVDRLCGGVGMRRGRRDPEELRVGDALDFWRVEAVEPGSLLRLRAEMRVPGRAWLEFRAVAQVDGHTLLTQTAFFEPKGLSGLLYWYALYPVHALIFGGLIRQIAAAAAHRGDRALTQTAPRPISS